MVFSRTYYFALTLLILGITARPMLALNAFFTYTAQSTLAACSFQITAHVIEVLLATMTAKKHRHLHAIHQEIKNMEYSLNVLENSKM